MKKLLSTILVSFSLAILPTSSNAVDITFSVGAGAMEGGYYGYGTETNGRNGATMTNGSSDGQITSEGGAFTDSTGVVFGELNIGDNMAFGVEVALDDLETPTNTNAQLDGDTVQTNTAQASFSDLTTVYLQARMLGGLYTKIMYHNVNVITNESLGTGGAYPDVDTDGYMIGVGAQYTADNGIFARAEFSVSDYDDVTAKNSNEADKEVSVTNMYGAAASIKIGKSF